MRIVITQGPDLIAVIENYDGPVPRVGEYIGHPNLDNEHAGYVAGCVKSVLHSIMGRPQAGETHFVGHPEPYVEVSI